MGQAWVWLSHSDHYTALRRGTAPAHRHSYDLHSCDRNAVPHRQEASHKEQVSRTAVVATAQRQGRISEGDDGVASLLSLIDVVYELYKCGRKSIEAVVKAGTVQRIRLKITHSCRATISPQLRFEDEHTSQQPGFACKIGSTFPVQLLSQTQRSDRWSIFDVAII